MVLSVRLFRLALLSSVLLLGACAMLPEREAIDGEPLRIALADYKEAKTNHARKPEPGSERRLEITRKKLEDVIVSVAEQHRQAGEWFQAQQVLGSGLKTVADSKRLNDAHSEVEQERTARLALNNCLMDAARARYLADKALLLETRAPLEAKDYLRDWLTHRERQELNTLGEKLLQCGRNALEARRLSLADETLTAAARARGEKFVATERHQLEQLRHPPRPASASKTVSKTPARSSEPSPQQKIRQLRLQLQEAMTHGNLKEAKATITELRKLEGDTPQLQDLDASIDAAIAAYIKEVNERASAHYREKQIEQARDLWREILDLEPDNAQARTNLERAERVLKKLEELQGTTPDAPPVTAPLTAPATVPAP